MDESSCTQASAVFPRLLWSVGGFFLVVPMLWLPVHMLLMNGIAFIGTSSFLLSFLASAPLWLLFLMPTPAGWGWSVFVATFFAALLHWLARRAINRPVLWRAPYACRLLLSASMTGALSATAFIATAMLEFGLSFPHWLTASIPNIADFAITGFLSGGAIEAWWQREFKRRGPAV